MNSNTHYPVTSNHSKSEGNLADQAKTWLRSAGRSIAALGPTSRGLILLLVLALVAILALTKLFPRSVTPASAPLDVFSSERAMAHLPTLASEPHPQGSPAQARMRDYLIQEMKAAGLEVEVHQTAGLENVVARLHGSDPTGAIVIQAHYDTVPGSPGAADNGSAVAALLEIARALAAGPALRNDVIALFDDGEEYPDVFGGTRAFVLKDPWMSDVRVAIGMDTAVRGFISTDDTGSENGWLVQAMARAYPGGAWSSLSGGGNYDSVPFRQAGIRVLELEDNYPFYQQHTKADVPEIVNPGSVQQLGEQALAVTRELGNLDLAVTKGPQQAYVSIPLIGLMHYPQSWSLSLAILAGILLVTAFVLVLRRKFASWRGLGVAALTIVVMTGAALLAASALWKAAPDLFGWKPYLFPEWPEVIPPNGWMIVIASYCVVLVLAALGYRLARRWSTAADFSLVGIAIFTALTVLLAIGAPHMAIIFTWPALLGSTGWILVGVLSKPGKAWAVEAGALPAAIATILLPLPFVPIMFMSDGTKSVALTPGVLVILLGVLLPAVDGLLMSRRSRKSSS
jgi:hypothetical protein